MAHLFDKGFCVRQPAWHGLAEIVQDYPGLEQAMKLAGHDHQIVERQLAIVQGDQMMPLSGYKALQREDTGAVISVMNASYEVIQNRVPWELIDTLFANGAKWDTAGLLKGRFDGTGKEVKGQVYWCLSLLDEPSTVKGDESPTYPYLAATWSHDGSQALRFRAMSVRIVCANTHHTAMFGNDGADLDVSIRHIGDVSKRIEKAKMALQLARKSQSVYLEMANYLANIPVNDVGIDLFIEKIIPMPDANLLTDRVRGNVMKSREQARGIFDSPLPAAFCASG